MDRKRVLGRGLSALIGEATAPETRGGSRYLICPVADITPNTMQPRRHFDDASLKELSASIKEKGVIEPLILRRNSQGYELVAGERRLRAAKMAGVKDVPAVVVDVTDEESLEFAIIENIQREDLNAVEEAEAYRSLIGFGLSQEEVAKRVGKERATVSNYLRLLKLPPEIKEELFKCTISMGHARAILSLDSHAAQTELCRKVITKGLSVREAEAYANRESTRTPKTPKRSAPPNPLVDELRDIFGTKVTLKERAGKGKVEIMYYSKEERERVLALLRSVAG